jgi:flagellar biosynthesis protein FlhG
VENIELNAGADDYRKDYEILELDPSASFEEIKNAYLVLKDLYSSESVATSSAEDEISEEQKKDILRQIEDAYTRLSKLFEEKSSSKKTVDVAESSAEELEKISSDITIFSGHALRQVRESLDIDTHEVALATKIRKDCIEKIEQERYADLPHEVYLRGFVFNYARYLSLDPEKVAEDYMKRYNEWRNDQKK